MVWLLWSAAWAASPAKDAWTTLLASGCNVPTAEIDTPFEARILRNTPYALAGYTFQNAALATFFRGDGGWYQPSGKEVVLDKVALACVEKLKAREAELQHTVPMSAGLMDRMSLDHRLFKVLRVWSADKGPSYAQVGERPRGDGGYVWYTRYPYCDPNPQEAEEIECGGYSIECPGKEDPCHWVAAG
jgi:hypothetical protein